MSRSKIWVLSLGVLLMGSGSSAQTPPTQIHPDLQVAPPAYGEEVLARIRAQAESLSQTGLDAIAPAAIHVPDYKVAYDALQAQITAALIHYFTELENINQEVKVFFSKIEGLRLQSESDPMFAALMEHEIRNLTPGVSAAINGRYFGAIRHLYLLEGTNEVVMRTRRSVSENQLRLQETGRGAASSLFRFCRTGACVMKLSQDIQSWNAFVARVNTRIDFLNFRPGQFWELGRGDSVPVVSLAMARLAEQLMSGLEENRQYNLASYLGDLAQRPGGLALAVLTGPATVFEKVASFASRIVRMRTMRLDLGLAAIGAYPVNDINEKVRRYANELLSRLPAVIYDGAQRDRILTELSQAAAAETNGVRVRYIPQNGHISPDWVWWGEYLSAEGGRIIFSQKGGVLTGSYKYPTEELAGSGQVTKNGLNQVSFEIPNRDGEKWAFVLRIQDESCLVLNYAPGQPEVRYCREGTPAAEEMAEALRAAEARARADRERILQAQVDGTLLFTSRSTTREVEIRSVNGGLAARYRDGGSFYRLGLLEFHLGKGSFRSGLWDFVLERKDGDCFDLSWGSGWRDRICAVTRTR